MIELRFHDAEATLVTLGPAGEEIARHTVDRSHFENNVAGAATSCSKLTGCYLGCGGSWPRLGDTRLSAWEWYNGTCE